jgi:aspartyl-tRNA(Asn)/glutamyl-tRNA(Gln) amidotransferase subunit B
VVQEITFTQRVKEGEDDYRYFPEPDLPPLVLDPAWVEQIRASLPELPASRLHRFQDQFGLNEYDAGVLVAEQSVADYFEATANAALNVPPKTVANWVSGELFGLLNQAGLEIGASPVSSQGLAELLVTLERGLVNQNTAKNVLAEMFSTGQTASQIISQGNLGQISDTDFIGALITQVLAEHTSQVQEYQRGKESIQRWLFGQVMRQAQGRANPQVVQAELNRQLAQFASSGEG